MWYQVTLRINDITYYVLQLLNTKDNKNKNDFLDFLVGNVASNFPELLDFCEEFGCVEDASRIDMQYIKGCLADIVSNICIIEEEIEKIKTTTTHRENGYFDISLMPL